jgi:hypothetical protein
VSHGESQLPAGNQGPGSAGEPWTIRRLRDVDGAHLQVSKAELVARLKSGEIDLEDEVLHLATQRWVPLWRLGGVSRPEGWDFLVASAASELSGRAALVRAGRLSFDEYREWRRQRLSLVSSEGTATLLGHAPTARERSPGSRLVPDHIRREYSFVRELGQGGFGSVSLWRNRQTDTLVAIKVTEPGLGEAVRNEVAMLEQLSSFHVVRVRHYGEIDGSAGRWFVIFDFVPGDTLAQFIAGDIRPDPTAVESILTDIARGLSHIHERQIVHRDLKPANIILRDTGEAGRLTAVLIDLGIARSEVRSGATLRAGTPGYQSPEQERGETCTAASDIFCFGLIAYELVTRRRVVGAQLLRLHDACPGLPPQLDALIKERCLVDDPARRIVDGRTLCIELGRIFGGAPVPQPPKTQVPDPTKAVLAAPSHDGRVAPWRRKQHASEARSKAESGDVVAMYRLAMMYIDGSGVPQDKREAIGWLKRAAAGGQVDAMLQLARELETVVGVDDDARAAVDWFRRAAAAGSADAMFDVATLHRRGFRGIVAPDRREWLDWIERAAMAGHPRAMWYLGIELREPDLRPQDRAQAVAWFREGAERRDWRSTLFLAWCLYRGDGCIRDRVEARRWAGRLAWLLLRSWTTTLTLWLFASAMGLTVFGLVAIAVSWRLSGWAPFGLGYPDWLWPFSGR